MSPEVKEKNEIDEPYVEKDSNKRHGCLTAWLIISILAVIYNTIYLITLFDSGLTRRSWLVLFFFMAVSLFQLVAIFGLFSGKKWGFYLFSTVIIIMYLVAFAINWSKWNFNIPLTIENIAPVLSIIVLYILLHVGGERKAWPKLK